MTDLVCAPLVRIAPALLLAALLGSCGYHHDDHAPGLYSVGGAVSGLRQGDSVLLKNGKDFMSMSANGRFDFGSKLQAGAAYDVEVESPTGYACKVEHGSGLIGAVDVASVAVQCTPFVLAGKPAAIQAPAGVAVDEAGNTYVLDSGNQVVLKISAQGVVSTLAGSPGQAGYRDGTGAQARFHFSASAGIAIDEQGNLGILDDCNGVIRKLTPDGQVTTLAGTPTNYCGYNRVSGFGAPADGVGKAARFGRLASIASDRAGGFYVADWNWSAAVRHISPSGVVVSSEWPVEHLETDPLMIVSVTVDHKGRVYMGDIDGRIWKFNGMERPGFVAGRRFTIPPSGEPTDGQGSAAGFFEIASMAVDGNDNLIVGDGTRVRKVSPAGVVSTIAGAYPNPGTGDGTGTNAQFGRIGAIASDSRGNLAVVERERTTVRQVDPAGVVSTMPQTTSRGYMDGIWSVARLNSELQPAVDGDGNLYVPDPLQGVIRKISADGTASLHAGTPGVYGLEDGPLAAATFGRPLAVAAGPGGSLYVLDGVLLRRIANGTVSTVATLDQHTYSWGLAVDKDANVAISGSLSGGVYLVSPSGQVAVAVNSDRIQELLHHPATPPDFVPQGVAFDRAGNLYISDTGTAAIYKQDKSGKLAVFAGMPMSEGDQDGPLGTAKFGYYGAGEMTIDASGNLYLSGQGRLRKISPAGVVSTPDLPWGNPYLYGLVWGNGKLYGMTKYAALQVPTP
jgi:sugar lactone lactonase YvrE